MKRYAGLHWLVPFFTRRFHTIEGLEHLPKIGSYILATNHIGSPDPMFIMAVVYRHTRQPVIFVVYDKLTQVFGKKFGYRWLGMIGKNEYRPSECLPQLRRELEAGNPVGIFPEGMRNAAPFVLPGKTGVARLAHWTGVPVIPCGFQGPFTWTVGQAIRASLSPRRNMALRIGTPLTFPKLAENQITKDLLTNTTRTIMTRIGKLASRPSPY
ncbi:MAG: lysophospholipid acyltransferase family protein [bacterium]|nr:lysophospholipid acyltransferase family protein [bacterium]